MAGIRKRVWNTDKGTKFCYEITYYINGKLCRKSGFKTKLEAQAAMPEITKSYSSNMTFKQLANYYINEHCEIHCKQTSINLYRGYLNNNLSKILQQKAKSIKKRDIDLLIIEWKQKELKNKTINDILGFVRSVFNYGLKNKWVSETPLNNVEKLPKEQKNVKFLNEDEIKIFVNFISGFKLTQYAALLTALYSGMRISELLAIEWQDIDFVNKTVNVNKQYYKGQLSPPKTYKSTRLIYLPDFVIRVLKKLKTNPVCLSKIVFCGKTGSYINQNKFVKNYFKKAMKILGKEHYNFHCLRHTYATYLLSNGIPLKFVQEQLGHSTAQTTLNVYSHVMPNIKNEAMGLFEKIEYEQNMSKLNLQ